MNIPGRIVGFLSEEFHEYVFEFDKVKLEVRLYSTSREVVRENMVNSFRRFAENYKQHRWLDALTLKGITSEGYLVYFGTLDNPSCYNGYLTYEVNWYYITDNNDGIIDEIRFHGREIDCFFDPENTFKIDLKYGGEKFVTVDSINIEASNSEEISCGMFMHGALRVDSFCGSNTTLKYNSAVPLNARSYYSMKLSSPIGIDELRDIITVFQKFLRYICYRTNVEISEISTYCLAEYGMRKECGKFVLDQTCGVEENSHIHDRIISASDLREHSSELLLAIDEGKIRDDYLCDSLKDCTHYTTSRVIMILAAFEREFREIYGQDIRRSEKYKAAKELTVECILNLANKMTGKQKKYIRDFAKGIENHDSSYGDNLEYAFIDCRSIMEPFVTRHFEGAYKEIVETVAVNINYLRNGIAHSRIGMNIEPRNLTDIKFVEEMIYVIRLKKLGLNENVIKKIINSLFRENIPLENFE